MSKGWLALELGHYKDARSSYLAAAKKDPRSAEAFFGGALSRFELGEDAAAARSLARALDLDPKHPMANVLAGFLAQTHGQRDRARAHYERYLKFTPDGPLAAEVQSILENL